MFATQQTSGWLVWPRHYSHIVSVKHMSHRSLYWCIGWCNPLRGALTMHGSSIYWYIGWCNRSQWCSISWHGSSLYWSIGWCNPPVVPIGIQGRSLYWCVGCCNQFLWDLSKVYLTELLGFFLREKSWRRTATYRPQTTCINFTVFSLVMAYNNKKVGGLFGYNFTLCVPNQHFWFSKFPIFKNIWIRIRIRSVFNKQKSSFSSILQFIKKSYNDKYYDILHPVARIIRQCLFESYFSLFSVYLKEHWVAA